MYKIKRQSLKIIFIFLLLVFSPNIYKPEINENNKLTNQIVDFNNLSNSTEDVNKNKSYQINKDEDRIVTELKLLYYHLGQGNLVSYVVGRVIEEIEFRVNNISPYEFSKNVNYPIGKDLFNFNIDGNLSWEMVNFQFNIILILNLTLDAKSPFQHPLFKDWTVKSSGLLIADFTLDYYDPNNLIFVTNRLTIDGDLKVQRQFNIAALLKFFKLSSIVKKMEKIDSLKNMLDSTSINLTFGLDMKSYKTNDKFEFNFGFKPYFALYTQFKINSHIDKYKYKFLSDLIIDIQAEGSGQNDEYYWVTIGKDANTGYYTKVDKEYAVNARVIVSYDAEVNMFSLFHKELSYVYDQKFEILKISGFNNVQLFGKQIIGEETPINIISLNTLENKNGIKINDLSNPTHLPEDIITTTTKENDFDYYQLDLSYYSSAKITLLGRVSANIFDNNMNNLNVISTDITNGTEYIFTTNNQSETFKIRIHPNVGVLQEEIYKIKVEIQESPLKILSPSYNTIIRTTETLLEWDFDTVYSYAPQYYKVILNDLFISNTILNYFTITDLKPGSNVIEIIAVFGDLETSNKISIIVSLSEYIDLDFTSPNYFDVKRPMISWAVQSGNIYGISNYELQIDGIIKYSGTSTSFTPTVDLAEGSHKIQVIYNDDANSYSITKSTIFIDTVVLIPSITSPSFIETPEKIINLQWNAIDDNIIDPFKIYRNNVLIATTMSSSFYVELPDLNVPYTFKIVSTDLFGRSREDTKTITRVIDTFEVKDYQFLADVDTKTELTYDSVKIRTYVHDFSLVTSGDEVIVISDTYLKLFSYQFDTLTEESVYNFPSGYTYLQSDVGKYDGNGERDIAIALKSNTGASKIIVLTFNNLGDYSIALTRDITSTVNSISLPHFINRNAVIISDLDDNIRLFGTEWGERTKSSLIGARFAFFYEDAKISYFKNNILYFMDTNFVDQGSMIINTGIKNPKFIPVADLLLTKYSKFIIGDKIIDTNAKSLLSSPITGNSVIWAGQFNFGNFDQDPVGVDRDGIEIVTLDNEYLRFYSGNTQVATFSQQGYSNNIQSIGVMSGSGRDFFVVETYGVYMLQFTSRSNALIGQRFGSEKLFPDNSYSAIPLDSNPRKQNFVNFWDRIPIYSSDGTFSVFIPASDAVAPILSMNSIANNTYLQSPSLEINLSITENNLNYWKIHKITSNSRLSVSVDQNTPGRTFVDLTEGINVFVVYAIDDAGNYGEIKFVYYLDTINPIIQGFSGLSLTKYTSVSYSYSIFDNNFDRVEIYINGTGFGTFYNSKDTVQISLQNNVVNRIELKAIDKSGRFTNQIFYTTVDSIPVPNPILYNPENNVIYGSDLLNVSYQLLEDSSVKFLLDDNLVRIENASGSFFLILINGNYNLTIISMDVAGNINKMVILFSIDLQAPIVNIYQNNMIYTNKTHIYYSWWSDIDVNTTFILDNKYLNHTLDAEIILNLSGEGFYNLTIIFNSTLNHMTTLLVVNITISFWVTDFNLINNQNDQKGSLEIDNMNIVLGYIYVNGNYTGFGDTNSSLIRLYYWLLNGSNDITVIGYNKFGNRYDRALSVINDKSPPELSYLDDKVIEIGSSSNNISWHLIDEFPNMYFIYLDDILIDQYSWSSGIYVMKNLNNLNIGIHNYTIIVNDLSDNYNSDTVFITVTDTTTPTVSSPVDIIYSVGETGNIVTWISQDQSPNNFTIIMNNTVVKSGTWINNETLSYPVDDLGIGIYNVTILLSDTSLNKISDTVLITVNQAITTVSNPADVEYNFGETENTISWQAIDTDANTYTITIDGTEIISATSWISNETVIFNVDGWEIGMYTIIITFTDLDSHSVSDTVIVTVNQKISPVGLIFISSMNISGVLSPSGEIQIDLMIQNNYPITQQILIIIQVIDSNGIAFSPLIGNIILDINSSNSIQTFTMKLNSDVALGNYSIQSILLDDFISHGGQLISYYIDTLNITI